MKTHYANLSNALEFLNDQKDSMRYKLVKKAKLHVESLLK